MTAKWIRKKRIEKKLTQKQLAKLVNVGSQSISNYETGLQFPSKKVLEKLIEVLDASNMQLCSDRVMTEIEHLSKNLVDYLKENFNPHTAIVIDSTGVKVVETTLFIKR